MPRAIDRRTLIGAIGAGAATIVLAKFPAAASETQFQVRHSPAEWRSMLGRERYAILREAATERPFSSSLDGEKRRGIYACAGCALPLFSSATKFDSGTGWPSFYAPLKNAVATRPDHSLPIARTEVLCRRCGGHLGHVFRDGPKPTGLRYCMNGLALQFHPA